MSALQQPPAEHHGDRRQPDLPLVLIDRWAQLAAERPWWYAASWAIGIGAVNLGLRMLLNDLSLARNTGMAILTAVGFFVFALLCTAQLTRPPRRRRPGPWKTQPSRSRAARLAGGLGSWPPVQGRRRRRRPGAAADRQLNPRPGGGAWSSPRLPSSPSQSPYLLVPSLGEVLFLREVTMSSSQAGGIEGHQWSLHRTFRTRLPCRIVCECGWTSTAGQRTAVLLQLKGHLEDSLHSGARLLPAHDQPSAEIPNTPSS
jgi:hypothetical protein